MKSIFGDPIIFGLALSGLVLSQLQPVFAAPASAAPAAGVDPAMMPGLDPAMMPGEIKLTGLVTGVDWSAETVQLAADSAALPGGKSVSFPKSRSKTIVIADETRIATRNGVSKTLTNLKVGMSIVVIGSDAGAGQPITARIITLQITSSRPGSGRNGIKPGEQSTFLPPSSGLDVIKQVSDGYYDGLTLVAGGPDDPVVLTPLQASNDYWVSDMAGEGLMLHVLQRAYDITVAETGVNASDTPIESLLSGPVVQAVLLFGTDSNQQAVGTLKDTIGQGSDPNKDRRQNLLVLYHVTYENSLVSSVQQWAEQQYPKQPDGSKSIAVALDTKRLGLVSITNTGTQTLHHCVITTHMGIDMENVVSKRWRGLALGGIGMSLATSQGEADEEASAGAAAIQVAEQHGSSVVYIKDLAPGAAIEAGFGSFANLSDSTDVDVSLWCDELKSEDRAPSNYKNVMRTIASQ